MLAAMYHEFNRKQAPENHGTWVINHDVDISWIHYALWLIKRKLKEKMAQFSCLNRIQVIKISFHGSASILISFLDQVGFIFIYNKSWDIPMRHYGKQASRRRPQCLFFPIQINARCTVSTEKCHFVSRYVVTVSCIKLRSGASVS